MLKTLGALVLGLSLIPATLPAPAGASGASSLVVPGPTHTLSVSGTGTGLYPAFEAGVDRYAVTTTAATGGQPHRRCRDLGPRG